jgi:diguanylate cyclase (GGDEF)-like protein/PAS domain S-box-containing protein/putative nucleotidyltransferase with HDIG domain
MSTTESQLVKMQKLSELSEQFLQWSSKDELDYQKINDDLLSLSGAKFSVFNLYDETGDFFRTVAISGDLKSIRKGLELAGIDISQKTWPNFRFTDPTKTVTTTTRFPTLFDYAGKLVPKPICSTLDAVFNLGEIIVVKIMIDNVMLGDFAIFMEKQSVFDSESIIEIYSRQVGLVVSGHRTESALKESETNFKALFEKGPIGIAYHKIILNKEGNPIDYLFLEANAAYKELTGIDPTGLTVTQAFPGIEKDHFDWIGTFGQVALGGKQIRFQQFLEANQRWYDCVAYQYKPQHFVAAFFEITEKKAIEKSLAESESLHKEIISGISDAILIIDQQKLVKYQSENCYRIFGWGPHDLIGRGYFRYVHPDDINMIRSQFSTLIEHQERTLFECRVLDKEGVYRTVEISAVNRLDHPGIQGILATMHDVTDRKKAELELRISEERYRMIAENVSDVIAIFNLTQGRATYVSPSIYIQRGVTVEEAMNEQFKDVCTPQSYNLVIEAINHNSNEFLQNPKQQKHYIMEVEQYRKDGSTLWTEISASYRFTSNGELEMLIVSRNIDERKKVEQERNYLNFHDHLTGLYNRRFFEAELNRLDVQRNLPMTVIVGDVNGLKLINDSFGHAKGDELLAKVGEILKSQFREDEIIARLSGDEFAIVLPKTNSGSADLILERLRRAMSNEKIADLQLSVSFGYGVKEFKDQMITAILKKAEDMMYKIKLYENRSSKSQTIEVIMNALFEKSPREQMHSKRVSLICEKMAFALGYELARVNRIKLAGLVHDIGKIGVEDHILNKDSSLLPEEWSEIRKHPEAGWRILNAVNEFSELSEVILAHHERWDGKGYPSGIKGSAIPVESRILAIADAYDAMTSHRSYRKAINKDEALAEIVRCSGTQFDPEMVEVFQKIKL